jgi:cobalamin biosynthesis protein CobD/CbiB
MKERPRFWIETGLAALSALFCVLTLIWKDWVEIVFRFDPDHHSGSVEWMIAAGALVLAIVFGLLARAEYRSHQAEPAAAAAR